MRVKIVLLAASAKNGKACVAGMAGDGKWIRLVTEDSETDGAVPREYLFAENKKNNLKLLDVIEVDLLQKMMDPIQTENYLVNMSFPPIYHGVFSANSLSQCVSSCDYIFGNCEDSLDEKEIMKQDGSLILVKVNDLKIWGERRGDKSKSKASFVYNGRDYKRISVTDCDYFLKSDEERFHNSAYIVVSIPHKPYCGRYYKFVSAIFPCEGESR